MMRLLTPLRRHPRSKASGPGRSRSTRSVARLRSAAPARCAAPSHPPRRSRALRVRLTALLSALALALGLTLVATGSPASATPPGIPHAVTAQAELNELTVAPEGSMAGYSRDLFPHWISSGGCTTRQTVLMRDGIDVITDSNCQPVSGRWYSPYDHVTLHSASEVDVDHVVALGEAWRSGASSWTTEQRRAFANDLDWPQLRAVSASSNRSKGDQDPAQWQPREAYYCTYSKMWIRTKHVWDLTVDAAEKTALQSMLDTC